MAYVFRLYAFFFVILQSFRANFSEIKKIALLGVLESEK